MRKGGPDWLRRWLGDERMTYFNVADDVYLANAQVADAELASLRALPTLRRLDLAQTRITDSGLRQLAGFRDLEWLILDGTSITDNGVEHLIGLKKLICVSLFETDVINEAIKRLEAILGKHLLVDSDLGSADESCRNCFSVRCHVNRQWVVKYKSPSFEACAHFWERGVHLGPEEPLRDGFIVLVETKGCLGAFIPTTQTATSVKYVWYYRTDGKGLLNPNDPAVQHGEAEYTRGTAPVSGKIAFGPFRIGWSEGGPGRGWTYYNTTALSPLPPDGARICMTAETDIARIDASDPTWRYKAFAGDEGQPANP